MNHPVRVYLIHGTFARGAAWAKPSGPIWKTIHSAFPTAEHQLFEWSGWNSHRARLNAGRELAERILADQREHGDKRVILVGHSHGGMVACYSASHPLVRARLHSAVFIATPFIACTRACRASLVLAILFGGLAFATPIIFLAYSWFSDGTLARYAEEVTVAKSMVTLVGILLLTVLVGCIGWKVGARLDARITRFVRLAKLPRRLPLSCPVFVAQVEADEARLALKSAQAVPEVPQVGAAALVSASERAIPVLTIIIAAVIVIGAISMLLGNPNGLNGLRLLKALALGVTAAAGVATLLSRTLSGSTGLLFLVIIPPFILVRLFAFTFTLDHPVLCMFVDMRTKLSPFLESPRLIVRRYAPTTRFSPFNLRHSLYEHRDFQTDLKRWLAANDQATANT